MRASGGEGPGGTRPHVSGSGSPGVSQFRSQGLLGAGPHGLLLLGRRRPRLPPHCPDPTRPAGLASPLASMGKGARCWFPGAQRRQPRLSTRHLTPLPASALGRWGRLRGGGGLPGPRRTRASAWSEPAHRSLAPRRCRRPRGTAGHWPPCSAGRDPRPSTGAAQRAHGVPTRQGRTLVGVGWGRKCTQLPGAAQGPPLAAPRVTPSTPRDAPPGATTTQLWSHG